LLSIQSVLAFRSTGFSNVPDVPFFLAIKCCFTQVESPIAQLVVSFFLVCFSPFGSSGIQIYRSFGWSSFFLVSILFLSIELHFTFNQMIVRLFGSTYRNQLSHSIERLYLFAWKFPFFQLVAFSYCLSAFRNLYF
jgi:hypothetical protein